MTTGEKEKTMGEHVWKEETSNFKRASLKNKATVTYAHKGRMCFQESYPPPALTGAPPHIMLGIYTYINVSIPGPPFSKPLICHYDDTIYDL